MKVKEFIETLECTRVRAYNEYSKDHFKDPFGKGDIEDKINKFLKENPEIEITNMLYQTATRHIHNLPVDVSHVLMTYNEATD
jgi:hypothetical protein